MATIDQVKFEIINGLKGAGNTRVLLQSILQQIYSDQTERIFNDGLNEKGSLIGSYAESTARIRIKYGRRVDKVNLDFTGNTKGAFATQLIDDKNAVVGFFDLSRKDIKGKAAKIKTNEVVGHIEEMYGPVFSLTEQESKRVDELIQDYIDEIKI